MARNMYTIHSVTNHLYFNWIFRKISSACWTRQVNFVNASSFKETILRFGENLFFFFFFIKEVLLCNGTNLHRFGEKILFCMKFCYFSHDLFVAFFFFSSAAYFYQSITNRYKLKIDWDNTHRPHLFSWTYIFLECRDTSSNVHSTEIKTIGDKNDCTPHAFLPGLCAKQFPGFLSVTPGALWWS